MPFGSSLLLFYIVVRKPHVDQNNLVHLMRCQSWSTKRECQKCSTVLRVWGFSLCLRVSV